MDKIKFQIHAETSLIQIMLWIIIWKLFGGFVGYIASAFILGNIYTMINNTAKLGKDYFKN